MRVRHERNVDVRRSKGTPMIGLDRPLRPVALSCTFDSDAGYASAARYPLGGAFRPVAQSCTFDSDSGYASAARYPLRVAFRWDSHARSWKPGFVSATV